MAWCVRIAVARDGRPYLQREFTGSTISIGAGPQNDLVLGDSIVSGHHADVMVSRCQLVFRDHSRNGSFHQGRRISQEVVLGAQGTISIPPFELELTFEQSGDDHHTRLHLQNELAQMAGEGAGPPAGATPEAGTLIKPESEMPSPDPLVAGRAAPAAGRIKTFADPPGLDAVGRPRLPTVPTWAGAGSEALEIEAPSVRAAPGVTGVEAMLRLVDASAAPEQHEVMLPDRTVRLGRSEAADIRLSDPTVSRLHAILNPIGDRRFLLTDLDSSNGTFVNGEKVKEAPLGDGDEIRFGEVTFRFHLLAAVPHQGAPVTDTTPPPESGLLDIAVEEIEDRAVPVHLVTIRGPVDYHTQLSDTLDGIIEGGARRLAIDLSQVDHVSPAGLAILVKCLTRLENLRGDLRLAGLDQKLRDAISLSRLDKLFKGRLVGSREQALDELAGSA